MILAKPNASDILCNSINANGTVITIPAGRVYTCDIVMQASQSITGTSTATLTFNPANGSTGTGPAGQVIVSRCTVTAPATGMATNNTPHHSAVFHGGSNGATLDFALNGSTLAHCAINGFLI